MFISFVFYTLAAALVASAIMVISARNPVHCALFLVMAFFTSAGIWLLLEAEFLAIVLVLVYVGAVMVLFLFVVMMLDINLAPLREGFARYLPIGALVAAVVVIEIVLVIKAADLDLPAAGDLVRRGADHSNTEELGALLYTVHLYAFELAAAILLVAIVAAIALTMRRRSGTKSQDPSRQVSVKRADRIRIVSMSSSSDTEHESSERGR
ncbi:MAG: NADH-quinone oxidoreductase subunit J [Ectothiorhodospiraceae bacterium AqS1]|nr:NADH-quinone oxidoreductase subunit J [Ectothiorhodospiraceae bacterium AqS1]